MYLVSLQICYPLLTITVTVILYTYLYSTFLNIKYLKFMVLLVGKRLWEILGLDIWKYSFLAYNSVFIIEAAIYFVSLIQDVDYPWVLKSVWDWKKWLFLLYFYNLFLL